MDMPLQRRCWMLEILLEHPAVSKEQRRGNCPWWSNLSNFCPKQFDHCQTNSTDSQTLKNGPLYYHSYVCSTFRVRYRQRYLDLIANPSVRDTFKIRADVISFIRRYLEERSFLEVLQFLPSEKAMLVCRLRPLCCSRQSAVQMPSHL